jgi:hypothetical protein
MNPRKLIVQIAMVALAAVVLPIATHSSLAAESNTKSQKLRGVVTGVTPASLTVNDGKGREVTIQTAEDYSDRILLGTQVTAWHHQQGEMQELDRVEYPLELSPANPGEFVPKIKKVILLPSSNAGDATAFYAEVERLLESRFNWVIAHRMLAEEIRRRDSKAQDAKPATVTREAGTTPAPPEPAAPELIQKIAEEVRADAVLELRVEYLLLQVKSHTAEWDGQRETFGSTGSRIAAAMTLRPVRGQVPAATVVLKLFDRQGQLLWSSRRGFRVLALQVSAGGDFRDRPLSEAFDDAPFVADWLNQAFASWRMPGSNHSEASTKN